MIDKNDAAKLIHWFDTQFTELRAKYKRFEVVRDSDWDLIKQDALRSLGLVPLRSWDVGEDIPGGVLRVRGTTGSSWSRHAAGGWSTDSPVSEPEMLAMEGRVWESTPSVEDIEVKADQEISDMAAYVFPRGWVTPEEDRESLTYDQLSRRARTRYPNGLSLVLHFADPMDAQILIDDMVDNPDSDILTPVQENTVNGRLIGVLETVSDFNDQAIVSGPIKASIIVSSKIGDSDVG